MKPTDPDSHDSPLRQLRLAAPGDELVFQITSDRKNKTIHVVRTLRGPDGMEREVASGFALLEKALAWVDADPARFQHPRLMLELKEVVRGLFEHIATND